MKMMLLLLLLLLHRQREITCNACFNLSTPSYSELVGFKDQGCCSNVYVCVWCVCVNGRRLIHYQRPFCQACESIFFLPLLFPPFSLSLLDCSMSSLIETTNKEEVPVSAVQPISGMIVRALLLFRSC